MAVGAGSSVVGVGEGGGRAVAVCVAVGTAVAVAGGVGDGEGVGVWVGVGDGVGAAVAVGLSGVPIAAVGAGRGDGSEVAVAVPARAASGTAFPAGLGAGAVGEGCARWVSNGAVVALGVCVSVGPGLAGAAAITAGVCFAETSPIDAAGESSGARAVTGSLCAAALDEGGLAQAPTATNTTPKHSSGTRKPRRGLPRANGCTSERGDRGAGRSCVPLQI